MARPRVPWSVRGSPRASAGCGRRRRRPERTVARPRVPWSVRGSPRASAGCGRRRRRPERAVACPRVGAGQRPLASTSPRAGCGPSAGARKRLRGVREAYGTVSAAGMVEVSPRPLQVRCETTRRCGGSFRRGRRGGVVAGLSRRGWGLLNTPQNRYHHYTPVVAGLWFGYVCKGFRVGSPQPPPLT